MKFCSHHHTRLKDELKSNSLWHLVSADQVELERRLLHALPADFDPLYSAIIMIMNQFVQNIMAMGEDPTIIPEEICPLCEVRDRPSELAEASSKKTGIPVDENWITGCVRDIKDHCRDENLLIN